MLPEERGAVEDVEGDAVGEFDEVELRFLRDDLVDVRFELGVGFEDFGADGALDRGFNFGFCACVETADWGQYWGRGEGGLEGMSTLS